MYAVVKIKNQQFRVAPDARLQVPLLPQEVGQTVTFDQVMLVAEDGRVQLGNPIIAGATVAAQILGHGRSRKIVVYKKKRRKNYRRKNGHRQHYTEIQVKQITV